MKKELLKDLTPEQLERVKACKNNEEILSLAKKEGFELTEEQLEAVSGGGCFSTTPYTNCERCGGRAKYLGTFNKQMNFRCEKCGHEFWK